MYSLKQLGHTQQKICTVNQFRSVQAIQLTYIEQNPNLDANKLSKIQLYADLCQSQIEILEQELRVSGSMPVNYAEWRSKQDQEWLEGYRKSLANLEHLAQPDIAQRAQLYQQHIDQLELKLQGK